MDMLADRDVRWLLRLSLEIDRSDEGGLDLMTVVRSCVSRCGSRRSSLIVDCRGAGSWLLDRLLIFA